MRFVYRRYKRTANDCYSNNKFFNDAAAQ